ncbi:hypothetical protein [Xylanibacillus composti]|uniref:hypothetical protein n=1 Tax=Xylanibacillus composti TaxID=1572762 RepID=UPI001BD10EA1|nr:hypothetical protein [Xylanibacillus composti]
MPILLPLCLAAHSRCLDTAAQQQGGDASANREKADIGAKAKQGTAGALPQATGSDVAFLQASEQTPQFRLMLGTSALEYAGSLAEAGNRLHFVPGQPAYAPGFTKHSEQGEGLADNALTAYLYVTSQQDEAVAYYAQPEKSVLYELGEASSAANPITGYMEIAVKPLPALTHTRQAFPAAPYGNLQGLPNAEQYAAFEKKVLAPARQARIVQATEQSGKALPKAGDVLQEQAAWNDKQQASLSTSPIQQASASARQQAAARQAVTRKGWLAKFNQEATSWQSLVLAQAQQGEQTLELAGPGGGSISGPLKEALQSNQLFLVAEGPKFAQHAAWLTSMLAIEGFSFDLEPSKWAAADTILIFKYCTGSLKELAANLESWTMAYAFNEGGLTQLHVQRIFENAEEMAKTHEEFRVFAELLNSPGWTGLLALNVHTPLEDLPPELAGLRAGIAAADFKAHHIGIHSSPVLVDEEDVDPIVIQDGGAHLAQDAERLSDAPVAIRLKDSSMFGLIYYEDETPMRQDGSVYRYRVKTLKVQFENSAIKRFSSSVELLVNQLFGDTVELQGAQGQSNVMALNGVYQEQAGRKTYVFLNEQDLRFRVRSEVLEEVELLRAQFLTETTAEEQEEGRDIESRFAFSGNLRFKHRPEFDLFSFGNGPDGDNGQLNFSNLALHMRFPQANPDNKQFVFDAENLAFNLGASQARHDSLYRHFPLKLAGFIQADEGSSPASLGYHSVQTPISETSLLYPWYGLEFELNLGSLGALASQAGFTAKLLAAWSPGEAGISMFTGMYLPGTGDSGKMFALENILRFSIDAFRMETGTSASGRTSYTLILNNLRLGFLGMQFPPSAYVDFVLFGNPDPSARADSLGWYASYTDESAIKNT